MIKLGLNNLFRKNMTQEIYNNALSTSVLDSGINEHRIRVRRDDDDFEKEFEPVSNKYLDTDSINTFLGWNILDGSEFRDYLYDDVLGVDSNSDGKSDGWAYIEKAGTITGTASCDGTCQKFDITNSTSRFGAYAIFSDYMSTTQGEEWLVRFDSSYTITEGVGKISYYFIFYNSSDAEVTRTNLPVSTQPTSGEGYVTNDINITVPSDGTIVKMRFGLGFYDDTGSGGLVGEACFKDAVLVKNTFLDDIGLLTEDDDDDGVANEWKGTSGSGNTDVFSIDSAQKIEITASTTTNASRIDSPEISISAGEVLKYYLTYKISGNVIASIKVRWYDGASYSTDTISNLTSTNFETVINEFTAPASTEHVVVRLLVEPTSIGNTGSVWFKDTSFVKQENSCYATKVFDKTGNENHLIQDTASSQPRLVNAGTYEVDSNGDYALYFDGTDDFFDVTDNQELDITTGNLSILARHDPDTQTGYILARNGEDGSENQYALLYTNATNTAISLNGTSYSNDNDSSNESKINVTTYDHSNTKMYLNGSLIDTDAFTSNLTSRDNIQVGCRSDSVDGSSKATFYKGHIRRIIIFDSALIAEQVSLLSNRL